MPRVSALRAASVLVLGLLGLPASAADPADKYPGLNLIPWPKAVQVRQGRMALTADSRIVGGQEQLKPLAEVLRGEIALLTGLKLKVTTEASQPGNIVLKINNTLQAGEPILGLRNRQLVRTKDGAYTLTIGDRADVFQSSPYFHIGSDEVSMGRVALHHGYKAFMAKHHLKNDEELANYFIAQVNEIVKKHGKKAIKWEGLANGASKDIIRYDVRLPDERLRDSRHQQRVHAGSQQWRQPLQPQRTDHRHRQGGGPHGRARRKVQGCCPDSEWQGVQYDRGRRRARVFDEDASHGLCGGAEEMLAIGERPISGADASPLATSRR